MNTALKTLSCALLLSAAGRVATAQAPAQAQVPPAPAATTPATRSNAQLDAGEPRANSAPSAAGVPAADAPGTAAPAPAAARGSAKTAAAPRTPAAAAASGQKSGSAADRLNLNTATVTGDREQPKVMYVVPWKSANIGDLSGKPMNSLLDEALAPVDRDEFKREVAYYDAVNAVTPQNSAANPAAKQGEK